MKKALPFLFGFFTLTNMLASGHVATASGTNPTCNGALNGSATAMAAGGTGPYGFTWTGPSGYTGAGATISSLAAGTYIVTATDSSDMSTAQYTLVLNQPSALTATAAGGALCAGSCMTLSGTGSGGTGSLTYSWSPATSLSSAAISNPSACPASTITYTLTVTDANSCIANATANVYVNPIPVITVSHANANCGLCTGSASASGAMTYSWSAGAFGNPAYNLCAGTYTVTGASSGGCAATATVTIINVSSPPSVSISSVTPASCGACNGTISATAVGGSPPYTYSWVPSGTGSSVSGLCPGNYTVSVTDAGGCNSATSTVINSTSGITAISASTTNSNCGAAVGSITITGVTGGTAPYTYSLNGSAFSSTTTYTGLPGGSYSIAAMDAGGCSYSTNVTILNTGAPTAVAVTTVSSGCTSSTGEINVGMVTGGTAPYTYSLDGSTFTSSTSYTGLSIGMHSLVVKDVNGCTFSQSVTVTSANPPLITTLSTTNISCSGGITGSVSIAAAGGSGPYTFLWVPGGNTTPNLAGVTVPGTYQVMVTDAAGCSATQTYYISNSSTLHGSLTTSYGNCAIPTILSAAAAGGIGPYTFAWVPDGHTTSRDTISANGYYVCNITDSVGCSTHVSASAYTGCYNLIKGRVYNDVNGNCAYDAGDNPIAGRTVWISGGSGTGTGYTDALGNYTIYTTGMSNTVTHSAPLYATTLCPSGNTRPANFVSPGDTLYNVDFADQYMPGMNDLVVNYYPGTARPGFLQTGVISYKNIGTTTISGVTIDLVIDSILHYNFSTPAAASYSYPMISWNIGTLTAGQAGYIYVYDSVPTIAAGGYLGRVLRYSAQINPVAGDNTPADNYTGPGATVSFPPTAVIVGAWDPNSKEVIPAGDILATDSVLSYKVQFQNTGTDTAFTVVVRDTLSPYLDPATVIPGVASQPYTFEFGYNGELTWTFSNILLVDSNRNEPASHGFLTYTVKQRANNPVGAQIYNTADIYFDFNDAVITNTTVNTIVDVTTGIATESTNAAVKVFPNPFDESTTFMITSDQLSETYFFELKDMLGKTVHSQKTNEKQFTVSRNGLGSGIYFYSVRNEKGMVGVGKVIIK